MFFFGHYIVCYFLAIILYVIFWPLYCMVFLAIIMYVPFWPLYCMFFFGHYIVGFFWPLYCMFLFWPLYCICMFFFGPLYCMFFFGHYIVCSLFYIVCSFLAIILYVLFWPLYCMFFFRSRLQITHLASSNFSSDFIVPEWLTAAGMSQIPVRAVVEGVVTKSGTTHHMKHYYDYTDFRAFVYADHTVFEVCLYGL